MEKWQRHRPRFYWRKEGGVSIEYEKDLKNPNIKWKDAGSSFRGPEKEQTLDEQYIDGKSIHGDNKSVEDTDSKNPLKQDN